ncbi:hypothetical protein [Verrucosispora sp. NA02020]|uniref:hypothetical protein n=1 Tax=Verrucosispora sp. NA02020 TaxID=2742132 RepID=UPI001591741F|nr:hypothetical protein [Verrucosispora sp. NA02020]QKW17626.1 hypothetical protein HUT12_32515 [Verrucosispora sp. NA02020]
MLDTSAIAAFVAGSMHVHEPILLADEASEAVAVPVACLVAAVRRDPGIDLTELMHHPQVVIVSPDRADDDLVLDWTLYYDGREDLAAAAVLSYRHGRCVVLTEEPDAYMISRQRPRWVVPIDSSW